MDMLKQDNTSSIELINNLIELFKKTKDNSKLQYNLLKKLKELFEKTKTKDNSKLKSELLKKLIEILEKQKTKDNTIKMLQKLINFLKKKKT